MNIIDVDSPRGAIHRLHYIAARKCPDCGRPLEYFPDDRHRLTSGGTGTRVLLQCPKCPAPPVEGCYIPVRGRGKDVIQENLHEELYMLADMTVAIKAEVVEQYRGVLLRPPEACKDVEE